MPVEVYVLALINLCIGMGYGIAAPVIPLLAKDFDVSDFAAASVVSVYALARVLAAPMAARLAVLGRPGVLMPIAMLLTAVTSVLAGLSPSFAGLLFWRGIGGAATVFTTVASQGLLYRVAPAAARGRAGALYHTGFLAGGIAGPLIGGLVAEISLAAPLLIYGALLLIGAAVAAWYLRSSRMLDSDGAPMSRQEQLPLREALRDRRFRTVISINFASAWTGNGLRFTVVPLFVAAVLQEGPIWTGLGLLVAALVQAILAVPAGRLTDRWSRRGPLLIGSLLGALAAGLLVIDESLVGYLIAMAVWGVSSSLLTVSNGALLGDVLDGRGGAPLALFQMVFDVATMLAPLVSGVLSDQISYGAAFALGAVVSMAAAVAVLFSGRTPVPAPTPVMKPVGSAIVLGRCAGVTPESAG